MHPVLSAKSHKCGIFSFLPNFTSVSMTIRTYLLSFVFVLPKVAVNTNTLFKRRYFYVGLRGANWGRCEKIPQFFSWKPVHYKKSHKTLNHKMSRRCTALPPAALPSLSVATSAMDPNRGAPAPYESNVGGRRQGSRLFPCLGRRNGTHRKFGRWAEHRDWVAATRR
jgi:hypothetical protein